MGKAILKLIVFVAVFVATIAIGVKIMNKGHDNLTIETQPASLPIVTMERAGQAYNELHGYVTPMDVKFQRDSVTVLGEGRDTAFVVDTYGTAVAKIFYEVRTTDGERLIENTEIEGFQENAGKIRCQITLKDLIEKGQDYMLAVVLELVDGRKVRYYTDVCWKDKLYLDEKLAFVKDFHERTFDYDKAQEIRKYLETNSKLEANKSFYKVNIHSSLKQLTYGDLQVQQLGEPKITITAIDSSTAGILLDFIVTDPQEEQAPLFQAREYYRIRYGTDRMYLLEYERTMEQLPITDELYFNDKFTLGITDEKVAMKESSDGNILAFEIANRLYAYNISSNKLIKVFGFYGDGDLDARTLYNRHKVKILDVNDEGDVTFGVYGYMNRGSHEGENGLQVSIYSGRKNTVEELVYIPSEKSPSVLISEVEKLLFTGSTSKLFVELDMAVYEIDLENRKADRIIDLPMEGMLHVSDNHETVVWLEGEDLYHSRTLHLMSFGKGMYNAVYAQNDEAILPLGFMKEDIIYGIAKKEDIVRESSGNYFFPMYKIVICDASGLRLKEYEQPGIYVTDCSIETNQITLNCVQRNDNGTYKEVVPDHISNNVEVAAGKNVVVAADIEKYQRYVQIKVHKNIDANTIKILDPKEVVHEGGRSLELQEQTDFPCFYALDPKGNATVCTSTATAISTAYENSGMVMNSSGEILWRRENRSAKNQIMAIKEAKATEDRSSLAVCLDQIFAFRGITCDAQTLLDQGWSVLDILNENLAAKQILDMNGCQLAAVLYYIDHEIPVLALLQDGNAVLLTGFNDLNVVVMNPTNGTLAKKGMNDTTQWLEENGNRFIAYIP